MSGILNPHILAPQVGPQTAFLASTADIVIYGGSAGSGKTMAMLLDPLRHINNKGYNSVIFRKTSPQIRNAGGLWDTSTEIYNKVNAKPLESRLLWKFPSGSEVRFGHMEYESDKYSWDGSQICMIGFDELQWFSETQFFYLLSRNRSTCGVKPYIRGTCNPDAESWLRTFIGWWIGPDGLPIIERSGQLRYMMRVDGTVKWASTKNELLRYSPEFIAKYKQLKDEYAEKKLVFAGRKGKTVNAAIKKLKKIYTKKIYQHKKLALEGIKSVTFIAASVEDNQILLDTNPSYLANLKALPLVERERLLHGNWNIKPESGKFFNRSWFEVIEASDVPQEGKECRYWDFAATKPSAKNKDPDYTCGIKVRKLNGKYYIIDVIRVRLNPASLEKLFLSTCQSDKVVAEDLGIEYMIRWEQEGGASGKNESYRLQTLLAGYNCKGVHTGGKNKEARARPLAIQAEIGNIYYQRAEWNEDFLAELHMFSDITTKHDDQVDGTSGAFNSLTSVFIHPSSSDVADDGDDEDEEKEAQEAKEDLRVQQRQEIYESLEDDWENGDDF